MEFSYTTTPPVHRAGVMTLGHHVTPNMVIPPQSEKYSIQGICSGECTQEVNMTCLTYSGTSESRTCWDHIPSREAILIIIDMPN